MANSKLPSKNNKPSAQSSVVDSNKPLSPAPAQTDNKKIISSPKNSEDFLTEKNSPFDDGYSINKEENFLSDFISGEKREDDPLFDRYVELVDRKERLEKVQAAFNARKGSDSQVKPAEFFAMDELGSLIDSESDLMTLHTKEAFRLFMGRAREPGKEAAPIVGGRRTASALRNLWMLTANDNPYADWALLRHEQSISEIEDRLANEVKAAEKMLHELQARGLTFSVLKSETPQPLQLGFKSPYGYSISRLIVDFDYFVRLQKTLARKTLRSDAQMRQSISEVTRIIRRVFNETGRFDRWLIQKEIQNLSRLDFIKEAAANREGSEKRVEFVTEVFGMVPADVFTAKLQPRHSRRRYSISEADQKMLQSAGVDIAKAAANMAAAVEHEDAPGLV